VIKGKERKKYKYQILHTKKEGTTSMLITRLVNVEEH